MAISLLYTFEITKSYILKVTIMNLQHELHDGVNRFVPGADTKQPHNVLVVKPLHHLRLAQEVNLLVHGAPRF